MNIRERLYGEILQQVRKPGRYLGDEWNSVHKEDNGRQRVQVALAFPDIYEIAMSHFGLRILYHILNQREYVVAERVFAPWVDMEAIMREQGIPLFSLESTRPIKDFDIIGFSLQYEMSYTNILNMLDLAEIPLFADQRGDADPLIIAGGPCAYNPEPLADFIDLFVIGDGEEIILEIVDAYKEMALDRKGMLKELAKIPGVYVPSLYHIEYWDDGRVKAINPLEPGVPQTITRCIVKDLDQAPYPTELIVPFIEVIHDRIPLEIGRGCTRGCRFCQAGIIYRPVRERSIENLLELVDQAEKNTGYGEVSLLSLSCADYSGINELIEKLMEKHMGQGLAVSLPSLRADSFSIELAREVQRVRKTGLTFAPEAGTQRLRDVINKGVTEEDLMSAVSAAVDAGWQNVKLYFMIGLPTETWEDIEGIGELARRVAKIKRGLNVTVSVSTFVPKAHTPFQWVAQDTVEAIERKQEFLKENVRGKGTRLNWHNVNLSFLEAVFSRGDRRLSKVLYHAWKLGCTFDSWSDQFDYSAWQRAFSETDVEPEFYANRERSLDELLPWEHIDSGVSKAFLESEFGKAIEGKATEDCRFNGCHGCGICEKLDAEPLLWSERGESI